MIARQQKIPVDELSFVNPQNENNITNMRKTLSQFTVTICLLTLINCSRSGIPSNVQNIQQYASKPNLLVGKWQLIDRYDVDSLGNRIETTSLFESFSEFGSEDKKSSNTERVIPETYLSFNSVGEGFTEDLGYGFNYYLTDSLLDIGIKYKILEMNDSILTLLQDGESELMSLSAGLSLQIFKRIDSKDSFSNRLKIKNMLEGKWNCDYIIPVEVRGNAMYEDKEVIKDTLATRQRHNLYLDFKPDNFEMGQLNVGAPRLFQYDIADSMINVDRVHIFTILDITSDSLSLLGIHSVETDSRYIWKMYKEK
ncbi:MAG: hypothetical protein ACJAS3_003610 [Roseivirga sp.]